MQCGGVFLDGGVLQQLTFNTANANPYLVLMMLDFIPRIAAGTVGPSHPAFVTVYELPFDGGSGSTWATPTASCAVTIASDACIQSATAGLPYLMSGTVSCPQPLPPAAGIVAPDVTIDDFSFVTTVN